MRAAARRLDRPQATSPRWGRPSYFVGIGKRAAALLALVVGTFPLSAAPLPREARVAAVAMRLGVAATSWCDRVTGLPGWQLQYLDDFDAPLRTDLAAALAMDRGPNVVALVAGGPAARAGVQVGDTIVSVGGRPVAPNRATGEATLAEALAHGPVPVALSRAGAVIARAIAAEPGCAATVRIVPIDRRNAYADGHAVVASTRIIDLAADDGELAALLAHEFAHNILHHGVATQVAPPPAILRAEEAAADRFSLSLMAAAGYDLAAAPRFWAKLLRDPRERADDRGHAPRRDRLRALKAEIVRMRPAVATPKRHGNAAVAIGSILRESRASTSLSTNGSVR